MKNVPNFYGCDSHQFLGKKNLKQETYNMKNVPNFYTEALNSTVGSLVFNSELANQSKQNKTAQKFWKLIVNASVIVTLATGVPQIATTASKLLPFIKEQDIKEELIIEDSIKKINSEDSGTALA